MFVRVFPVAGRDSDFERLSSHCLASVVESNLPSPSFEQLLDNAATEWGIEPGYWDIWGKYHVTTSAVKRAILRAMGVPCETAEQLQGALAARQRRDWERLVPHTLVVPAGRPHELPMNIPAECLGAQVEITIHLEDGGSSVLKPNLWELRQTGSAEMGGRTIFRKIADLPPDLPLGYHDVFVRAGGLVAETRYIVTPERTWTHPHLGRGGKAAGITVSLYGLRSERNWGCGDFRDLLDVANWVARELQVSFIGLNPLHAIHNRRPFNTSPYLPKCIFYQNFIYLDVEGIEDFPRCRRAQQLRNRGEVCAEMEALRAARFVEYERVAALKLRFLKLLFVQFLREWRNKTPRAKEFEAFRKREGRLLQDFATYCAVDEHLHRQDPNVWVWEQWPEPYRQPDSPEVEAFRARHWRSVLFYQYLQWQIDIQLRHVQERARAAGLSIGLYHDLALATDRSGADLWAHRPFFASGCQVGAPPDDFSPGGQDWGFPPPNPEHHRETGYRLFAESIRRNCRHGGALRIDHVMRLFRLYWIPDGMNAVEGAYVRERAEDYLRILALESVRNQVIVIGEDLGTVEPEIREELARFGVLSYRLFYFERDKQGEFISFDQYPRQALVSSTTHDLPTVAGFWTGADIQARLSSGIIDEAAYQSHMASRQSEKQKVLDLLFRLSLLPQHLPRFVTDYPELTGELHNAIVGFLALTPSQLLAINQEDLTKEVEQQNLPGTTWQYPNWGRKMRFTLEQLRADPEALAFTAMFRNWILRSERTNRLE